VTPRDVSVLACPRCRGDLAFEGTVVAGELGHGHLACAGCGRRWPVEDGLPDLIEEDDIDGTERFMRGIYDRFARLHDPLTRWLFPVLQFSSERAARDAYAKRLALGELARRPGTVRPRVLEVGVGGGANLSVLARHLPPDASIELWGVDFSRGMLAECRRRRARHPELPVRLALADAHALPFADQTFERVFHVGGIGAFRDPRAALAEMARVARAGTPIVVVDEQLDPARRHGLYHRLAFRVLAFYDAAPVAPVAHLPAGASEVAVEQVSRFYYCLSFRVPQRETDAPGRAAPI
jgi:ubiquinone/menaquinone biosynthesis C-methylase UbiE